MAKPPNQAAWFTDKVPAFTKTAVTFATLFAPNA